MNGPFRRPHAGPSLEAMETMPTSPVLRTPAANPAEAVAYFTQRLTCQTDVADVHAAVESGDPGFVLVDSRGQAGWDQGHIPGAVHLPTAEIVHRATRLLDPAVPVVTYCWGPGCNGSTRAALELARLGYRVKEMIGGIEYWIREGLAVRTASGAVIREAADPLTAPAGTPVCDC